MPRFDSSAMENHQIGGSRYGFSAKRIEDLGASEYTLVTLVVDVSSSVAPFRGAIEGCVKESVKACRHSPRSDNLLLRLLTFGSALDEVHGFRPLTECDVDKYNGSIVVGGMTALYDACHNAVEATSRYGKDLQAQDFQANAIVIVITDGENNASAMTPNAVKDAIAATMKTEALESIRTVLVGVNTGGGGLSTYLQTFQNEVGFDQYVDIADASDRSLAKLAAFVSKSVSSQSQALGTGGPSQALVF